MRNNPKFAFLLQESKFRVFSFCQWPGLPVLIDVLSARTVNCGAEVS